MMADTAHWFCAHNQQYCAERDAIEASRETEKREDIVAMDVLLLALARLEHRETGNTVISDQATRLLIKIAGDLVESE